MKNLLFTSSTDETRCFSLLGINIIILSENWEILKEFSRLNCVKKAQEVVSYAMESAEEDLDNIRNTLFSSSRRNLEFFFEINNDLFELEQQFLALISMGDFKGFLPIDTISNEL